MLVKNSNTDARKLQAMSLNFTSPKAFPDMNDFDCFSKEKEIQPQQIKERPPMKTKVSQKFSFKN